MKGQLSYIIKPLSLVLTIILLLLLYNSISSFGNREKVAQQSLDLVADATNILLVLSNSQLCLAYQSPTTQGLYANIVDVNKLNYFAQTYPTIEPNCARNFDYGWRVTVKEYKQVNGATVYGKNWTFGSASFSQDAAFRNSVDFSIPIAIHYSDKLTRPALMTIHLVDGELERISGIIDWACQLHRQNGIDKISVQVHTSYPISYKPSPTTICQVSKTNSCRATDCALDFAGFKAAGNYLMKISFNGDTEVIR
jgi:hypothetical protein